MVIGHTDHGVSGHAGGATPSAPRRQAAHQSEKGKAARDRGGRVGAGCVRSPSTKIKNDLPAPVEIGSRHAQTFSETIRYVAPHRIVVVLPRFTPGLSGLRDQPVKSIAVFNNKGGVGKTTLLCNLAAYLSIGRKKHVLVVDADPQCNATQSLFSDDIIEDLYEDESNFTIYSVVQPLSIGKGYSQSLLPKKSFSFNIDVLPGDPRLALTEDLLATDWTRGISGDTRGLRTSFLFTHLLERCDDYDFVLFDMGPSLGSINRAVLIATDFFISPMSIDIFSLRAIENIAISFDKWRRQLKSGLELNEDPDSLEIENPGWRLQFAGYVTQQYTAKRDIAGKRRPVKAFEKIMTKIPNEVNKYFLDEGSSAVEGVRYELGTIPTLHSLIPMSQTSRKPIFELKAADGVVGAHFSKVKEYKETITGIADRLLANVELLG